MLKNRGIYLRYFLIGANFPFFRQLYSIEIAYLITENVLKTPVLITLTFWDIVLY